MKAPDHQTEPAPAAPAERVIQVENLEKRYLMGDTVVRALRGISFDAAQGEYIAVMGHSGSGKSTLLNILGCLDVPSDGAYRLDGQDVAELEDAELSRIRREKIGFVFQSFNLIPQISVLENIEVPLFYMGWHERESARRAADLAETVGLGDRIRHRPTELSGGQRQRVAIARALANDPRIILADEPTGNLDTETGQDIMAILDDLVESGITIVLVTHEEVIAKHARRTVRLSDGKIVEDRRRTP